MYWKEFIIVKVYKDYRSNFFYSLIHGLDSTQMAAANEKDHVDPWRRGHTHIPVKIVIQKLLFSVRA